MGESRGVLFGCVLREMGESGGMCVCVCVCVGEGEGVNAKRVGVRVNILKGRVWDKGGLVCIHRD